MTETSNYGLKEDIREYWSRRSETFDLAFGHRIPQGPEFAAWQSAIRSHLGAPPLRVLELACGTGEVTNVLLSLGHEVTALDFSEAMLDTARRKHAARASQVRFLLADAENSREPDESYDAIVCRHLVWTLTEPDAALADWHRILKPGGLLLMFDGDWSKPSGFGHVVSAVISVLDRVMGVDVNYDGAMSGRHADIMRRLPFGQGLTLQRITPLLIDAGFVDLEASSHAPIARAQRKTADLRNKLRTLVYRRFTLSARRPLTATSNLFAQQRVMP